jgi:hypothetical protein
MTADTTTITRWRDEVRDVANYVDMQSANRVKSDAVLCKMARRLRALAAEMAETVAHAT